MHAWSNGSKLSTQILHNRAQGLDGKPTTHQLHGPALTPVCVRAQTACLTL